MASYKKFGNLRMIAKFVTGYVMKLKQKLLGET